MSDIQELLDELDIEQWCEDEGVQFKKTRGHSGMQLQIRECPSCQDRRSRTYINAETGIGNCFVCNATFTKYRFIRAVLDASDRETIERIKADLKAQGWRPRRTQSAAVIEETVKLPISFPIPTPEGESLIYLEDRGIPKEIAAYFRLRCCLMGWWEFTKEDGGRGGQCFDNRLIIPVYDLDGTLVTFQGRDLTGKSDRKYLFPKQLPGTGKFLFNGQNATHHSEIVVGEGAFDVMAIKIAFDEDVNLRRIEAVGTFGKHLSYGALDGNDQLGRFIKLKQQGLKRVTIMWDGESSALSAALNAAALLHKHGLEVRVALLPAGRDPNEITGDQVRVAYYQAKPFSQKLLIQMKLRSPYRAAS